jgi:exopolyphosphatase/guanosine-5'-triphosphate,3'-diphosphate pyrophosphatase
MRLGVLDVGSNTVHLLVVDAHPGARPLPAYSHKATLRLAELLDDQGAIGPDGVERLAETVREARAVAEEQGVAELLPFATSAVRDASNADAVLDTVEERSGVRLTVLSGEDEARLTFLAARRWLGWSAGRLLLFDIGGGSLEIAYGTDEAPDVAVSLPLGAGRLTAARLPGARRTCARCGGTCAARSPTWWGGSPGSGRRTGSWPPRRRSGSWRGSRGRLARARGCTCAAT